MQLNKRICLLLILGISLTGSAQLEFSKWYFGQQAGLDFSTSPPTVLTNGVVNTSEGVASICDNAGNLLFYTEGIGVANSNHVAMANGTGLSGGMTSTQSAMIIKQPGNSNIYYIFTVADVSGSPGARYSIVDMNLAAGLGSVTVKNATLYTPSTEKQVAVRHCNGRDVWAVSHHQGTNEFRAYLLNSTGISSTPVISLVGDVSTGFNYMGQLKISPDGKKLAMASCNSSSTGSPGGFYLFDFDAATGAVSNSLILLSGTNIPTGTGAYGMEFSPDGSKLYGTTSVISSTVNFAIHQWNICASSPSAIIASQYSISTGDLGLGSIQRAIDNKIYIAAVSPTQQSLGVINNPNASGAAMNFVLNGQSIAPKYSRLGLPNYINMYTRQAPSPFINTLACQTSSFSVPPVPTFSSGCTSTPYTPSSYLWDFGEPSAGAANTSTAANPVHTYSSTGTYTVSLILYGACTNDTLVQTVNITTPGPTVSVAGNFTICNGDKHNYTVSGASTYTWSSGPTTTIVSLNPTSTTAYSVSGTFNGCTLSKSFTVSVNPCLGITALENNDAFNIFPNPFTNELSVEATAPSNLMIFDLQGHLVMQTKLVEGHNQIDTSVLKAGVYFIHARNSESIWRGRFVKVE